MASVKRNLQVPLVWLTPAHFSRGDTHRYKPVTQVANYDGSRSHDRVISHRNTLADSGANTHKAAVAKLYITAQRRARRYRGKITNLAIVIDAAVSVEDGVSTDHRARIDCGPGHDHRTLPDVRGIGDNRAGVDQRGEDNVGLLRADELNCVSAIPVVANGDACAVERLEPPHLGDVNVPRDNGNTLELSGSGAITNAGYLKRSIRLAMSATTRAWPEAPTMTSRCVRIPAVLYFPRDSSWSAIRNTAERRRMRRVGARWRWRR